MVSLIEYRNGNMYIISDFEIRPLREDGSDIDLFVPIDYRTMNLYIDGMPNYIHDRIQILGVRSILIRFSTEDDNNHCTVHFLRSVGLQSAYMNFVFDYDYHHIRLEKREYSVEMYITKNSK